MSEELTLSLNGKEYQLTEGFKESVEQRARGAFKENDYVELTWSSNERGDPILNIETEGHWVPWDMLDVLEFDMEEIEQATDSDDTVEDVDAGNGMKTVPRDEVDMSSDDAPQEEEPEIDTKFMVTPASKNYIPQPESADPDKLPPDPSVLPSDPALAMWIPEDSRTEIWETGRSLIRTCNWITWNVQVKADEVPDGATKIVQDDDGHVKEVPRTTSHNSWESLAKYHECEVVAEEKPSDSPPETNYDGKKSSESVDGIAGGNNWSFGNG